MRARKVTKIPKNITEGKLCEKLVKMGCPVDSPSITLSTATDDEIERKFFLQWKKYRVQKFWQDFGALKAAESIIASER